MIEIKEKHDCCGCHACVTVCAKHCITMHADEQGFLYPIVDKDLCSNCRLCETVCPVINHCDSRKPIKVYAAKNNNEEIRLKSSSGGIFTLLAEAIINEGGVVFGARFDNDWNVIHDYTETQEGIEAFRGSKYVQSIIGNSYKIAKQFLKQGRKVLFSGTPCQIAGLKKYLRKHYDNLLTIDVVCHGVPSPLVWQRYLEELKESLRTKCVAGKNTVSSSLNDLPVITGISFRDKTNGWKKFGFRVQYNAAISGENSVSEPHYTFIEPFDKNPFMQGFLANLYLRPSCYKCPSKSGKSESDITIADFWGIQNYYPEYDDNLGTSLILINTSNGLHIYESLNKDSFSVTYEHGFRGNPSIENSVLENKYVFKFWNDVRFKTTTQKAKFYYKKMKPSKYLLYFKRLKNYCYRLFK